MSLCRCDAWLRNGGRDLRMGDFENTWIKNTQAKENRLRKWNEQTKHKIACLTERQF